jgi:ATP-dependent protease ClpP protease subunit
MFSYNTSTKEIFLYDYIGPEWFGMIDAGAVQEALNAIPGRATVRINSGGGGVDEGIGIYEMLRRHPGGVDVVVDSSAYSIASVIMLAGESLTMARGAAAMLHSPWMMFASGNAKELRKIAQQALDAGLIDAIDGQAVEPVAAKYRNIPAAIARAQKAGDRTPYPFARESAKLRLRKNS